MSADAKKRWAKACGVQWRVAPQNFALPFPLLLIRLVSDRPCRECARSIFKIELLRVGYAATLFFAGTIMGHCAQLGMRRLQRRRGAASRQASIKVHAAKRL